MKRTLYFDILNICACFAVICLHCNGVVHTYSDTLAWKQALLVECVMYWAVPIFFMLSGATLLKYRQKYSTKEFFRKRISKTVIPFIVWSVIVAFRKGMPVGTWGPRTWFNMIFMNRIETIYWFFFPLFAVYFSIPVLSWLTEDKHRKTLWYMVIMAFFTYSFLPVVMPQIGLSFNGNLSLPVMGGVLLFVVLGYLVATEDINKKQRMVVYGLAVFSVLFRYIMTWKLSSRDGVINKTFFGYLQFHSVFLGLAVFLLFKNIPWEKFFKKEKCSKFISTISSCSFGIYLIHMTTYWFLNTVLGIDAACWQWRVFAPFVIYLISLVCVCVMKKIPILKRIVP